jgi:gag-polyprotein putative aspartyl protease
LEPTNRTRAAVSECSEACLTIRTRLMIGWTVFATLLVGGLFAIRWSGRGRYKTRARFPDTAKTAVLAIRDPLVRPELVVMATMESEDRRQSATWMMVDSGATGVTTPWPTYRDLRLEALSDLQIRSEDPRGRVLVWQAGLVPVLRLGELEVREVVTALGGATPVLGQSVLSHATWEVDWDRGTLTLGAPPWASDLFAARLPLRRVGDADVVTVELDGVALDMVVDTGAFSSAIPTDVGQRGGLRAHAIAPTTLRSAAGDVAVRAVFAGEMRLGAVSVGHVEIATFATGGARASYGLLGLDVLSQFAIHVTPGESIALAPRGDVRATTARRIARWPFVPTSCHSAECVRGELTQQGDDAILSMKFEADVSTPIELLMGCAGDLGASNIRTRTSIGFRPSPEWPRHLRVRLPNGMHGAGNQITIPAGSRWFEVGDHPCRSVELLDIAPLASRATSGPAADAPTEAEREHSAMLWP